MSFPEDDPYSPPSGARFSPPQIRFNAIAEGWGFFKAEAITWLMIGLAVLICNAALSGLLFELFGRPGRIGAGGFRGLIPPLGLTLNTVITAAVNGLFLGAMFRVACLQIRGRAIRFSDLFGVTDVILELLTAAVLSTLICVVGGMLCLIPGLVASGLLMFTLPLIVDGRLTATDAIKASFQALKKQWLAVTIFHLVAYMLTGLGACCFLVGLLFTMPLYSLSIAVLYRDFFLSRGFASEAKPKSPDPYF